VSRSNESQSYGGQLVPFVAFSAPTLCLSSGHVKQHEA